MVTPMTRWLTIKIKWVSTSRLQVCNDALLSIECSSCNNICLVDNMQKHITAHASLAFADHLLMLQRMLHRWLPIDWDAFQIKLMLTRGQRCLSRYTFLESMETQCPLVGQIAGHIFAWSLVWIRTNQCVSKQMSIPLESSFTEHTSCMWYTCIERWHRYSSTATSASPPLLHTQTQSWNGCDWPQSHVQTPAPQWVVQLVWILNNNASTRLTQDFRIMQALQFTCRYIDKFQLAASC